MSELRFDGRVVVVTGAGRGVGRAHALAFAGRGAAVVVNDLGGAADGGSAESDPVAAQVVAEIEAAGGQAVADTGDISDPDQAAALIGRAITSYGRIDVVVNNAGIDVPVAFDDVTPALLQRFLAVHVLGTHQVTAAAWPHLRAQRYGRILLTTSSAGYFGLGDALPYATAKGALHAMTQSLAIEGAPYGITANAIAPFADSRLAQTRTAGRASLNDTISRLAPASAVAPVALWLAHESTELTGRAFEVGAGIVCRTFAGQAAGISVRGLTPEDLRDRAPELLTPSADEVTEPGGRQRALTAAMADLAGG